MFKSENSDMENQRVNYLIEKNRDMLKKVVLFFCTEITSPILTLFGQISTVAQSSHKIPSQSV